MSNRILPEADNLDMACQNLRAYVAFVVKHDEGRITSTKRAWHEMAKQHTKHNTKRGTIHE